MDGLTQLELARALCDSSSHLNLLPHSEQRPCQYHLDRAAATMRQITVRRAEVAR